MDLKELGAFVRARRDRIRPDDVGLSAGARRRVPGLRREEVALLAGASVEYVIDIERGSGVQSSEQMLAALARALRLSRDECNHLYYLAGRRLPLDGTGVVRVDPALLDLMERLGGGTPAQIITDLHAILAQNPLAEALLGRLPAGSGRQASFIWHWFTDSTTRTHYPREDHRRHAVSLVADLRAAVARRGTRDLAAADLVSALLDHSSEFRELWGRHDVQVRREDRKRLLHPVLGLTEVNCLSLHSEDGRQRLLWFAPTSDAASLNQLNALSALGAQEAVPAA